MSDEYTCAICNGIFEKTTPEDEVRAEEILKIPKEAIKNFVTQEILDDLKVMGYIFIDKIDGSGGFILSATPGTEDIINELLKDPQYILRESDLAGDKIYDFYIELGKELAKLLKKEA